MSKVKTPKLEEMLEAGVHFGHQVRRWNPKMEPYIYTVSKNAHIIDLEQTQKLLADSANFLYEIAKKGGRVIFVGTKKQAREIVEAEAKRCGAMYVNERWIGGTITNFKNLKKTIEKFLTMIKDKEEGKYLKYTKKENLMMDRQIVKFQTFYGGIASMKENPQALFIIDPKREKTAVREATGYNIPVVSLIDTNGDPSNITYVIPGNDDAIKSIALIVKTLADAVEEGYKDYEKELAKPAQVSPVQPVQEVLPETTAEAKKEEKKIEKKPVAKAAKPKTAVKKSAAKK
jgi:small subunit ribosomal protein S2